jgi:predicted  nucleic acid-binding Zn-ribbon protein
MTSDRRVPSELMQAAQAFDDELDRFSRLAEAARRGPLNSQKSLERAARTFQEVGEAEKRLAGVAQTLVVALGAARERQENEANALQARAREIEQRTEVAAELLTRYGALGEQAAHLNQDVQALASQEAAGEEKLTGSALVAVLAKLRERMNEVARGALSLVGSAREGDFDDIGRTADSLRQQIVAAEKKVAAIEKSLSNSE